MHLKHKWTEWSDPKEGANILGTVIYQARTCTKCHKIKARSIRCR